MKKPFIYCLVATLIIISTLMGCKSSESTYINDEISQAFVKILDEGMYRVNSDLDRVDKDIIETEIQLLQLHALIDPAQKWVEEQKTAIVQEKKTGAFTRRVDKSWLSENFANEQFAITDLSVTVENIGSPTQSSYSKIEVTDVVTKTKYDGQVIQDTLESRKASLEQNKQKIMSAGEKAISTMVGIIDRIDEWKVSKVDNVTFLVTDQSLGVPSDGTWTYYKETGEIVANDRASQALKRVLLGQ